MMKGKRDGGFSLVELIVVIAIMAVLVGVLAPAYLKYVEKSRKSKDIALLDEVMRAGTTIATDPENEYYIPAGSYFYVKYNVLNSGIIEFEITGMDSDTEHRNLALEDWKSTCGALNSPQSLCSKSWKDKSGKLSGLVNPVGVIKWELGSDAGVFAEIAGDNEAFRKYFEAVSGSPAEEGGEPAGD